MAQCIIATGTAGSFYDPQLEKRTLLALNEQRSLSQFCDVILKVCGEQIFAHSNILSAASPYFSSFFGTGADFPRVFSQKVPQIIEIHIDTKDGAHGYGEAVKKIIDYMYAGQIILPASLIGQIVEISRIMRMENLLLFCEQFQKGENNNYPCDASTCTSGLEEIVNLLYGRSKTKKHVDASTEIDMSIFKRTQSARGYPQPVVQVAAQTDYQEEITEQQCMQITECAVTEGNIMNIVVTPENDTLRDLAEAQNNTLLINQNEVSLLLEISKERTAFQATETHEKSDKVEQVFSKNPQATDHQLENGCTIADLMSLTVAKSVNQADSKQMIENTTISQPQNSSMCTDSQTTSANVSLAHAQDINLEEISDLVKFGDLVSTTKYKHPPQALTVKRSRGRPRGRGRGRGRGRRPGRPPKIVEELEDDEESEGEFDDFMKHLQQGSSTEVSQGDTTNNSKELERSQEEYDNSGRSSGRQWTSRRKRSTPSQLKKDYVIHSLVKKSRSTENVQVKLRQKNTRNLKFVCNFCPFATSTFKEYSDHLKRHPWTDPRTLKCDRPGCDFKTLRSREFTAHKQGHMLDDLICVKCEDQFTTLEDLEIHLKRHEGDFPYFCKECDSRFRSKTQLMAHKPKHQLEKPFVCPICLAGFKWKHALKNHMVTHSGTKDHLCDECGYATAHKSQLKAHMLIHSGLMFRCPWPHCSFRTNKRMNLKYHMVTHTHEKPHQCDICGQSFSLKKNMRRHMLLHTEARPYSCKLCGFSTTRYDKLKLHNQKLHSLKESVSACTQSSSDTNQLVINSEDILSPSVTEPRSVVQFFNSDEVNIMDVNSDQVHSPSGENKVVQDGPGAESFKSETLHTIAQLATNENIAEATIIQTQGPECGIYPIMSTIEFQDASGKRYKLLPQNLSV